MEASEYKLNNKVVAYSNTLTSHNILVEGVASQSQIALLKLVDQITGPLKLKGSMTNAKRR